MKIGVLANRHRRLVIVLILVIALSCVIVGDYRSNYREAKEWSNYGNSTVTFRYPTQWHADLCKSKSNYITLNGTIKGEYTIFDSVGGSEAKELRIVGRVNGICDDKGVQFVSIDPFDHCYGKKLLSNGISIGYIQDSEYVMNIFVCDREMTLFTFSFEDTVMGASHAGSGAVPLHCLERSPQYKDIVKFAESIRIKNN